LVVAPVLAEDGVEVDGRGGGQVTRYQGARCHA
jgi:hypothetical protein